ncbi:MAG: tetratricopeptide repeat protein [Trueperella sp.]|nr:tetratricopeptide repeat protein [Trueperella sp.]
MSIYGAVDLSQFKKQPEPAPTATPASPLTELGTPADGAAANVIPGPISVEVTADNLNSIMQTSTQVPVVLVFHSAKSEKSGELVAQLTELANKLGGRFQLGSVDTDVNQQVTAAFSVTAVPSAVALLQGQPIPLFQGMPAAEQLSGVVDQLLAAAAQYGISGRMDGDADATPPAPELPPLYQAGIEALEAGDLAGAHAAYEKALAENPGDSEARIALNQVELLQRLEVVNPGNDGARAQELLQTAATAPLTDLETQLVAADVEMSISRPDAAFARLIDVVKATSGAERETARQRLVALFDTIGENELVAQARRALANALF